jgi:hypothetical protein
MMLTVDKTTTRAKHAQAISTSACQMYLVHITSKDVSYIHWVPVGQSQ